MLEAFLKKGRLEAGCDEAGRGCLAGPVYAAAVILPVDCEIHPLLNDSKKLNKKKRDELRIWVENTALAWAVASLTNEEIDELNILRASILGMHKAVEQLDPQPEFLLIDGNRFYPLKDFPYACIVKGDGIFASIAAASILAKTYRDEYMESLHQQFPEYNWNKNKGYPTKEHRKAIVENGTSPYHRKSFRLTNPQLTFQFSTDE